MKININLIWLFSIFLSGCFINYPIYYDNIVKTKSLPDFVAFTKKKELRYKKVLGSSRNLGLTSSGIIVSESYDNILEDQIPGKSGIDIQMGDYKTLPFDFWGAQTGKSPVIIKGRIAKKSKKVIVIIHGVFFSKRTAFLKKFAQIAHLKWGYTVVNVDLRGHGEHLTFPQMSLGVYEGLDICYLAKKLKQDYGMEYVGVIGFSLGAHVAIRAAYEACWEAKVSGNPPVIDAAIAISPPANMEMSFKRLNTPGFGKITDNFFYGLFKMRIAALKKHLFIAKNLEIKDFSDYVEKIIIPHYQIPSKTAVYQLNKKNYFHLNQRTQSYQKLFQKKIHKAEDLLQQANSYPLLPQITIPLLVIHSEDDIAVSVENTLLLKNVVDTKKLKNILIMIVPDGGHIAFHEIDPNWTFNMVYAFHYFYAYPKQRDQFQTFEFVGPLWYYFDRVLYLSQLRLFWTLF